MISYFAKNSGPDYFDAVDQILRYLAGSQNKDITFEKKPEFCLIRYLDFDWAKDHTDRKLILSFVFTLNREPINYGSKKQAVVPLSSTKIQYVALILAA